MNRRPPFGVCYERGVQRGIEPDDDRDDEADNGTGIFDRAAPASPLVLGAVAFGGVIGATGRWGVAELMGAVGAGHHPGAWGWATLIVNVVGSLLIGLAARRLDRDTVAWAFAVTGVLGGFTTFSALAVELNDLADAGRMPVALVSGAVTIAMGVAAVALAQGSRRPSPGPYGRHGSSGATT